MKHFARPELTDKLFPLDRLVPYPGNARVGDTDVLMESLVAHGQYRPVLVRAETLHVLAGWHLCEAAAELGATHVAVELLHGLADDEADELNLIDNQAASRGTYDYGLLSSRLEALGNLRRAGYTDRDKKRVLGRVERSLSKDFAPSIDWDSLTCPKCNHRFIPS